MYLELCELRCHSICLRSYTYRHIQERGLGRADLGSWLSTVMAFRQFGRPSSLLQAAAIVTFAWSQTCTAHEHHAEDVPEGEAVSPEPLVRSSSDFA